MMADSDQGVKSKILSLLFIFLDYTIRSSNVQSWSFGTFSSRIFSGFYILGSFNTFNTLLGFHVIMIKWTFWVKK